jgi:hypothetical protein
MDNFGLYGQYINIISKWICVLFVNLNLVHIVYTCPYSPYLSTVHSSLCNETILLKNKEKKE